MEIISNCDVDLSEYDGKHTSGTFFKFVNFVGKPIKASFENGGFENCTINGELLTICTYDKWFGNGQDSVKSPKHDHGKPRPSLVPSALMEGAMRAREYGLQKYSDPENWRKVELHQWHNALLRHALAMQNDPWARDEESGLLHIDHMAITIAFMLDMYEKGGE